MPRENRCLEKSRLHFSMAGAVFAGVGVSLFVAGAALGEISIDSRSAKCCIFPYKMRLQGGTGKDGPRMVVESSFYWRKQFTEFPLKS